MSADILTPAILNYISHGHFPSPSASNDETTTHQSADDDDTLLSAPLTSPSTTLSTLLTSLRAAQREAKSDLRQLSRSASAATDVDDWISRAQALQTDILRSRDAARAIVAEAEVAKTLRAEARDQEQKIRLLEVEVRFNESLTRTLEGVGEVEKLLAAAKEGMVAGRLAEAMGDLREAERGVEGLNEGRIKGLLSQRRKGLVEELREVIVGAWSGRLGVDVDGRMLKFTTGQNGGVSLEEVVDTAQSLGVFKSLVEKLGKDIAKAIVTPRLAVGRKDVFPSIVVQGEQLRCEGETNDSSYKVLFEDIRNFIDFLTSQLPSTISVPLSETLLPTLTTKLEEDWLTPAIPLNVVEMPGFQEIFDEVLGLAGKIDAVQWHGGQALREWVQGMPRTWITRKREQTLGDVRNLSFEGIREIKVVERVETQTVSKDDTFAASSEGADDEWDTAWDEPEEQGKDPEPLSSMKEDNDEDDTSAWDVDEPEVEQSGEQASQAEEEDAWGWGDGDDNAATSGSAKVVGTELPAPNGQKPVKASQEREMTLREQYSITAVPDDVIAIVKQIISDAERLTEAEYATLPIAPAASALYTLPTLALAIYRATAPTSYAKLGISNMLIYNDASRLSDQLRSWQASQPPASRLRLDNDVKALDQFAKRAYSTEMESQRTILRDLLDGTQGFSNCSAAPFKDECEAALEQTIHRLRDVHRQWTGILPPSALLQSVGSLLGTVTGKIITDVEDLPDISEADSKELKVLCDQASTIKNLFMQESPDGRSNDMTFIYCPNWLKFQYLGELMESSLADIKYLWKEGELSLEFDAEEVVGLIEALFAESQLRRQAITEIRRGSRR